MEEAIDEVVRLSGSFFDPRVVEAFLATWNKISQFRDLSDEGALDID